MHRLLSILLVLLLLSCSENPEIIPHCFSGSNPPRNSHKVTIDQGLWGDIWFWSGNFMPVNRGEICQVKRTLFVYELTTLDEVDQVQYEPFYTAIHTELVATVESDEYGFFQVELEPGDYSLFVEEDGMYYANLFEEKGIYPVHIESGKVSEVRFDITYEASY